jgi:hypothetical protein
MSDKLRPCPWCGGDASFKAFPAWNNKIEAAARCLNSTCRVQPRGLLVDGEAAAIAAWNQRVDPVKAQLVEALVAALPQMDYKLTHTQTAEGRRNVSRVIEQARKALADAEAE